MRLYLTLIITALILAFTSSYFLFSYKNRLQAGTDDVLKIEKIKAEFITSVPYRELINLNSLYFTKDRFSLFSPVFLVSNPDAKVQAINYASNDSCFLRIPFIITEQNRDKLILWEEFRCGARNYLPSWFFEEPPYIHPSGMSYAYLAYQTNREPFKTTFWLMGHLRHFHISELKEIKELKMRLNGPLYYLSKLADDELKEMANGRPTILNREYMIAKNNYGSGPYSDLEYRLYLRTDLEVFLKSSGFNLDIYRLGKPCFYRDGSLCWNYDSRHVLGLFNTGSIIALITSGIILSLVLYLLITKLKMQKMEGERKRLALQVLTHEFRTPITSLLLQMENLRHGFDHFDPETQDNLLRMSSDIYRLKRMTESSRNYLKSSDPKGLVDLHPEKVSSINSIVEEVCSAYDGVEFVSSVDDQEMFIDTYWLRIVIKNLVENAVNHGTAPVKVWLTIGKKEVAIHVQDQGECSFENIEDMCREFVKGPKSEGTGLGMNIVAKVVNELNGELKFSKNPTTFTVVLKKEWKNGG
jgi:signal transduction histidine kinase